jgi:hypothetical protein
LFELICIYAGHLSPLPEYNKVKCTCENLIISIVGCHSDIQCRWYIPLLTCYNAQMVLYVYKKVCAASLKSLSVAFFNSKADTALSVVVSSQRLIENVQFFL